MWRYVTWGKIVFNQVMGFLFRLRNVTIVG
jgi:hypothetical protein